MGEYLRRPLTLSCAVFLVCLMAACGPTDEEPPVEEGWSCETPRDGWERCDGDSVVWCHAVAHGNYDSGHFHESVNCAQDGMECVALTDSLAACADTSRECAPDFAQCDGRQALNCVNGNVATMRCSIAEMCQVGSEGARCLSVKQD